MATTSSTNQNGSLSGKTVLITGATSGIGLEASVALAKLGAKVVMVGRNPAKTVAAVSDVKARSGSSLVDFLLCDFSSQASIRKLAETFREKYDRLDVLLNNAGSVFEHRELTEDGIEKTFAVNHLGYFLLTNLLLDVLEKSAPSRVVNVASRSHYSGTIDFENLQYENGGYFILGAYARSKLANVIFTNELARRLAGSGVTANSLHPGVVATNIWSNAPSFAKPLLWLYKKLFMVTPEQGSRTMVCLASSPEVEGVTGKYFDNNRKERRAAKLALDEALAERLWTESERLVGLTGEERLSAASP